MAEAPTGSSVETAAAPDESWLRRRLTELSSIERPSASPGEREAAEWLAARLAEEGAEARIELERAHGTYWWPLGIGAAAGALAGLASLRGHRLLGAALGAAAAAAIVDEYPPRKRWLRRRLPHSQTTNVVCEIGPAEAERTIVFVAHHDAAHSGLVFNPALPDLLEAIDAGAFERTDTSPPLMWPIIGGPALVAAGSMLASRRLTGLGTLLSAGSAAAMAEIGMRPVVPGANDNGTAVVLLIALARALIAHPPSDTRVLLVSAGSEESFSEGMKAFGERHFGELPTESTFFCIVDTLGSPHLNVLRGEGFVRMHEYPSQALDVVDRLAEEMGIWLFPNLRLRNGTDGLEPLAAGYPTIALCSCDRRKQPSNYHWPSDTADNVDYGTLADAIRLCEALVRRLDASWL